MENWGLITYRETALLYDPAFSSNSNKERVATIIAHELAHMVSWRTDRKFAWRFFPLTAVLAVLPVSGSVIWSRCTGGTTCG